MEILRNCGDTLLTIINDILDFSKIESGRMSLEDHPFELRTCLEEALELLGPKAAEKKLDLAFVVDPGIPSGVIGDVTRLRQILVNLVGNAVKFTETGEVVVTVEPAESRGRVPEPGTRLTSKRVPEPGTLLLHFTVRDTGIGIPKDRQDRLF